MKAARWLWLVVLLLTTLINAHGARADGRPIAYHLPLTSNLVEQRPKGHAWANDEIQAIILENWTPAEEAQYALKIAERESGLNPFAVGKAGERGLFQILPSTFFANRKEPGFPDVTWDDMFIPQRNIQVAVWIRRQDGWSQWSTAWDR